jgi:hypothetical protein
MSKKAQTEDLLQFFFAVIAIIVIIFLFALVRGSRSTSLLNENQEMKSRIEGTRNLNTFLIMEVNEKETVADLILRSYIEKDYVELEKITKEVFQRHYPDGTWKLEISTVPEGELIDEENLMGQASGMCEGYFSSFALGYGTKDNPKGAASCTGKLELASMPLPYPNDEKINYLAISLFQYRIYNPAEK